MRAWLILLAIVVVLIVLADPHGATRPAYKACHAGNRWQDCRR